jgi:DNA-binding NtrC family response regulator
MIADIKEKLWGMLKEKEVSLVMLLDNEGHILWHKGREIYGNHISMGDGFSRSLIEKALQNQVPVEREGELLCLNKNNLPGSAMRWQIKSILVLPLANEYMLYLDSGNKETFSAGDRAVFKVIGSLLGDAIAKIKFAEAAKGGITGSSEAMKKIRGLVEKFAMRDEPILLRGETGCGKNHIAELIHAYSGCKVPLVVVNTPTIPENLFESELFGHKKGGFSDAIADKKGLISEAEKGILFFDEIAEIPLSVQAKLLQFVETHKYRIIGDPKEYAANVRIIAASNRQLKDEKTFRADLYFRLSALQIDLPPLRERQEDIRQLIEENIDLLSGKTPTQKFWDVMLHHDWPGNVRELLQVLKRAGIMLDGNEIGAEVATIIDRKYEAEQLLAAGLIRQISNQIADGKSFWNTAWKAFINRDLSRFDMKNFLTLHYNQQAHSLKKLAKYLHVSDSEYSRFVSSLHRHQIHPGKEL